MLSLPAKSLKAIKKYLIRQKQEVEKEIRGVERDDPTAETILAETSEPGMDSWLAEAHNRAIVLKDQLMKAAHAVKIALLKIRKRTYGICDNCHEQIEAKRLEAMPTANLCLSCSKNPKKK